MEQIPENVRRTDRRYQWWLLVAGLGCMTMLLTAGLRETVFAPWRGIRAAYAGILAEKATDERGRALAQNFEVKIEQNVLNGLGRVDRCITCHPGIDDPRMADQRQPFRTHPNTYLNSHPPEKFGCTVCHRGQGRALVFEEAKAVGHHWDYPLLPKNLTQSSCGMCHTAGEVAERGGEKYALGATLFDEKGCQSCHKIAGRGGSLGPALDRIGLKTRAELPMAAIEGEHTLPQWLLEHFADPQAVVAGSQMYPPRLSPDDAEALTIYMLSLQNIDLPESYLSAGKHLELYKRANPDPLSGEQLFGRFCSTCHDTGEFGRWDPFFNRFIPGVRGPSFVQVAPRDYIERMVRAGRAGTLMPGWSMQSGGLRDAEIAAIVDYLRAAPVPEAMKLSPALIEATNNPALQFRGDANAGARIYDRHCLGCHGPAGAGQLAPSLANATFQSAATDGFIYATIAAGRKNTAMPAFLAPGAGGFSGPEIMHLIAYIRTFGAPAAGGSR